MESKFSFSKKQLLILNWWSENSPHNGKNAIICDGAIRSGKTFCMAISFILWAQRYFKNCSFGLCGKTIQAVNRNIIHPLLPHLKSWGFKIKFKESKNYFDLRSKTACNRFYLFGGKDEAAASFIQGITLAGVLFDEVALLPRSFVEQAIARCSVSGSRFWFNCNPQGPMHWFFTEWIQKKDLKNALYLQLGMQDNPTLSQEIQLRYHSLYSGVFYKRYIQGLWVASDGLVYPCFDPEIHVVKSLPQTFDKFYISCDYGIVNPSSFGLWGRFGDKWYRIKEYYYDSKIEGISRTDLKHYEALKRLAGEKDIEAVIVDPSAASFIECIKRGNKFKVIRAKNEVLLGINHVSNALHSGKLLFSDKCQDSIQEFSLYEWSKSEKNNEPKKQNDHAMDEIRYFVETILEQKQSAQTGIFCSVNRYS